MIRAVVLSLALSLAPADDVVRVEADEVGIIKQQKLDEIAIEVTKLAEQAGIAPDEMRVSLVWADREALVYGIRVRIVTDDAQLTDPQDERGPVVHRCESCNADELITFTVEGAIAGIDKYEEAKTPAPKQVEVAEPEPTPQALPPDAAAPADTEPSRGLDTLGKIGVAGIVVGASTAITGGAFVGIRSTRPSADPTQLRNWLPAGYALLGAGAAVLVTGVALLVVDRTRAKRGTAMAPLLGPGFAGASVRARF